METKQYYQIEVNTYYKNKHGKMFLRLIADHSKDGQSVSYPHPFKTTITTGDIDKSMQYITKMACGDGSTGAKYFNMLQMNQTKVKKILESVHYLIKKYDFIPNSFHNWFDIVSDARSNDNLTTLNYFLALESFEYKKLRYLLEYNDKMILKCARASPIGLAMMIYLNPEDIANDTFHLIKIYNYASEDSISKEHPLDNLIFTNPLD